MTHFLPSDDREAGEFAWQCSTGHWNRSSESICRQCHEPKFEQAEMLRELLEKVHREHPRPSESD